MSARLSRFDALLTRRRVVSPAAPALTLRVLSDPWGEPVAEFSETPCDEALIRAAFRIADDDWLGVLADDSAGRGLSAAWRLSLIRADRHGRARVSREPGPQWVGAAVHARPGQAATPLREQLLDQAVQQLWRSGWTLKG